VERVIFQKQHNYADDAVEKEEIIRKIIRGGETEKDRS
jgi:hypothetical protein